MKVYLMMYLFFQEQIWEKQNTWQQQLLMIFMLNTKNS